MLFTYYQHDAGAGDRRATTRSCRRSSSHSLTGGAAGFIVAAIVAAALSPSLNAMAAATVNDFYRRYYRPGCRRRDAAARGAAARRSAGASCSSPSRIGAQWMERSVLDNGLSVLSLAAGPVLGAFLVGVLTQRVGTRAMLTGMVDRHRGAVRRLVDGASPGRGTRSSARR